MVIFFNHMATSHAQEVVGNVIMGTGYARLTRVLIRLILDLHSCFRDM